MVDLLLRYNLIGPFHVIFKSSRIIFNHNYSQILIVIDINLDSELDLATTFCLKRP